MTKPSWQDFATHDESIVPELWDGVIGAWAPCLGPTGSRLHDHSRRSNWGTLTNITPSAAWGVYQGQYALDFTNSGSGSQQYVDCGAKDESLAYPFSMSCWLRNLGIVAADTSPFSKAAEAQSFAGPLIYVSGAAIAYWAGAVRASGVTNVIGRADWWQVGICWTGSQAQVIVNGKVDGTGNTTSAPNGVNQSIEIGRYATNGVNRTATGQIDDCVIWRRCLSPNEWRQLYQLGRGGMYQRRRRRAIYLPQAGFQAAWALRRSQIIGGGLR